MVQIFFRTFGPKLKPVLKKIYLPGLSILSGILLFESWPVSPLTALIFVALIPLLLLGELVQKKNAYFGYTFLAILIWNASTTWWIWNSTDVGSIAAIIANSLLMCLPWWGYYTYKNRFGRPIGLIALICFWMMFEYIHLNWQLSWPWLTLGNVFASHPDWVQWYEYTGVSGGTLWILIVNILLFQIWVKSRQQLPTFSLKAIVVLTVSFPYTVSGLMNVMHVSKNQAPGKTNVLIIQPNIDPYQKFEALSIPQSIDKLIRLSEQGLDSSTQLILWPETALAAGAVQNQTTETPVYKPVFDFINRHPGVTLLTGIEGFKTYGNEQYTATARKTPEGIYYDAFNSAVVITSGEQLQFYNKSKLVPGVESLPTFLNFMSPVFEHFGGTTGGYGRDTAAVAFRLKYSSYIPAPVICYESIYGEYVTEYVKKGANIITIMTNDGWWGNTGGHKQHLEYARLRAIESRRYVARSANTGISAVIDDRGNILATQPWDKAAWIRYNIPLCTTETFYVRYGDYLYKIASLTAILLIGLNLILYVRNKKNALIK